MVGDNATTPQTRGVTETDTNAVIDTVQGDAVTNRHNEISHTDNMTKGEQVDILDSHIHGNIGVTTSQQMLTQELELGYWNVYEKITELFLQEFVIPVYS